MKKTGAIFVEVLVSILLFTVGILALTATLFYGVRVVVESREETIKVQEYKNSVERDILGMIQKNAFVPTGTPLPHDVFHLNKNDLSKTMNFTLYRYKQEGKEGTEMYLLKKGKH